MRTLHKRIFLAALLPMALHAQEDCGDYLDDRAREKAYMAVLGTAHFNVSRMLIDQKLTTASSYSDFWTKSLDSILYSYQSYQQSGTSTVQGQQWSDLNQLLGNLTQDAGIALQVESFMVANAFSAVVDLLQSLNTGVRTYAITVPVAGRYRIEVQLTGDFDKPRNRVLVSGPTGNIQLADENPSSSCGRGYWVDLQPGAHVVTMALGSGWSATFHNAGTLTSVYLDNPTPIAWSAPIVIASKSVNILEAMPVPGCTSATQFAFSVPTTAAFPNVVTGSVVVDEVRPLNAVRQPNFVVTWTSEDPYMLCINECRLAMNQDPQVNVQTGLATYYFRREEDVVVTQGVHGGIQHPTYPD